MDGTRTHRTFSGLALGIVQLLRLPIQNRKQANMTYTWFSWFMIVLFHEVSVNTDLENTETIASSTNMGLGSSEPLVTNFCLLINTCFICVSVEIHLIIWTGVINIEFRANSTVTDSWAKPPQQIYFLHEAVTALCWGTLASTQHHSWGAF